MSLQITLADVFVHRDSRRGEITPGVRYVSELKEALDTSVLAVLTVKHGEEQIDRNNVIPAGDEIPYDVTWTSRSHKPTYPGFW
jgi:hypothetical protein